jgi:O-acetyl-ADP-ribose deacetylase (regulator of RNase III)
MLSVRAGSRELQLVQGDITKLAVDAMVNAANAHLAGGGGVDGAIHAAGGAQIMRELAVIRARIGTCAPGNAVATGAGLLPAKYVFHAVGPIYRGGDGGEPAQLELCYRTCLEMASERELETISFPSISTGVYSYPLIPAARIAIETVWGWLNSHGGSVKLVKLVQFSAHDHTAYCDLARRLPANIERGTSG